MFSLCWIIFHGKHDQRWKTNKHNDKTADSRVTVYNGQSSAWVGVQYNINVRANQRPDTHLGRGGATRGSECSERDYSSVFSKMGIVYNLY